MGSLLLVIDYASCRHFPAQFSSGSAASVRPNLRPSHLLWERWGDLLHTLLFHPLVAPDALSLVAPSSAQKTRPLSTGRWKGFRARMVFARKPKWRSTTFQPRL